MTKNETHSISGTEKTLETFVDALKANVPAAAVINIDGVPYTQADLVKKAEEELAYFKSSQAAKDASKKATADLRQARPGIKRFVKSAKIGMKSYLGVDNPDIEKFGFHLDKTGELSADKKAIRAEKARRTREARHTMGSRQKQSIHAPDVSSITIPNPSAAEESPNGSTPGNGGAGPSH